MKQFALLLVFLLFTLIQHTKGQNMNQSLIDPFKERPVLIDEVNRDGLIMGEMGEFFQDDYKAYTPDTVVVNALKASFSGIRLHIVFGSWCGDSKEQLPRFLKIMDQIGSSAPEMRFTAVDSSKKGRFTDVSPLRIERVPTFIVYRNGAEIGRIVETPLESLEKDLQQILLNP